MESVLKNIYINKIQVPKFHGHVRLELRGCRETEVIEHDNHMTNALEQILSTGLWRSAPEVLKALCPTYQIAYGGLLLTDKSLADDAVVIPGGTEVTACGSYGVANNDSALTQGSYNTTESVVDWPSKKMTYVYDWTTNQGNGTIAAAALTHASTGKCGYGDAGVLATGSYSDRIELDLGVRDIYCCARNKTIKLVTAQYMYAVAQDGSTITVTRYRNNKNNLDPFSDSMYSALTEEKVTYEEFKLSSSIKIDTNYSCTDGKNIYLWDNYWLTAGATGTCTVIDTSDMSVKYITVKNQTGSIVRFDAGFVYYNKAIYTFSANYDKIIEINTENTVDIKEYELGTTTNKEMNKISSASSGKIFIKQSSASAKNIVFDCVTKSVKVSKVGTYGYNWICTANPLLSVCAYNNGYIREVPNLMYLATICNLDKPVTKTADKTMKVTYTIQQE